MNDNLVSALFRNQSTVFVQYWLNVIPLIFSRRFKIKLQFRIFSPFFGTSQKYFVRSNALSVSDSDFVILTIISDNSDKLW